MPAMVFRLSKRSTLFEWRGGVPVLKGGFLIFDDFEQGQWLNLEVQMRRVLPESRWVKIDVPNPLFDSFFHMER